MAFRQWAGILCRIGSLRARFAHRQIKIAECFVIVFLREQILRIRHGLVRRVVGEQRLV